MQLMMSHFPSAPIMQSLMPRVACVAFVHVHRQHRTKLDPRVVKCVFLGYAPDKKGYKCFHPSSHRFFVSMDVTFHETESFFGCPQLQGESLLEAESFVLKSFLPLLPVTSLWFPI